MRKIVLYMFTTLDGFIAGPDGEFDADFDPADEEMAFANELFRSAEGIMFGRLTYEGFTSYWDALDTADITIRPAEIEFARIFKGLTRVVVSTTLDTVPDNTILIRDDIGAAVSSLKQRPGGDLLLVCGPRLLATLVESGVVEECRLMVRPIAWGRGTALFGDLQGRLPMTRLDTRVFESGVVMHHYRISRA